MSVDFQIKLCNRMTKCYSGFECFFFSKIWFIPGCNRAYFCLCAQRSLLVLLWEITDAARD